MSVHYTLGDKKAKLMKDFGMEHKIRIDFEPNGKCTVLSQDGSLISSFQTPYELAFNSQYGTPISNDDQFLFVGTWYNGLYCYEISTGNLLWKKGPGRVRTIIPIDNYVIVEMQGRGIYKRTIQTGDLVTVVKMSGIENLFQISENEIFAGPKRNRSFVYQIPELIEKQTILNSVLNPNDSLTFVILDCHKAEGHLVVSGWEEYPHKDYLQKGSKSFERWISA